MFREVLAAIAIASLAAAFGLAFSPAMDRDCEPFAIGTVIKVYC